MTKLLNLGVYFCPTSILDFQSTVQEKVNIATAYCAEIKQAFFSQDVLPVVANSFFAIQGNEFFSRRSERAQIGGGLYRSVKMQGEVLLALLVLVTGKFYSFLIILISPVVCEVI